MLYPRDFQLLPLGEDAKKPAGAEFPGGLQKQESRAGGGNARGEQDYEDAEEDSTASDEAFWLELEKSAAPSSSATPLKLARAEEKWKGKAIDKQNAREPAHSGGVVEKEVIAEPAERDKMTYAEAFASLLAVCVVAAVAAVVMERKADALLAVKATMWLMALPVAAALAALWHETTQQKFGEGSDVNKASGGTGSGSGGFDRESRGVPSAGSRLPDLDEGASEEECDSDGGDVSSTGAAGRRSGKRGSHSGGGDSRGGSHNPRAQSAMDSGVP